MTSWVARVAGKHYEVDAVTKRRKVVKGWMSLNFAAPGEVENCYGYPVDLIYTTMEETEEELRMEY